MAAALVNCLTVESLAKDCALSRADYMLVMALEGENVAHKLHQEVSFHCHCACMWCAGLYELVTALPDHMLCLRLRSGDTSARI